MPFTDSDPGSAEERPTYQFSFDANGPYGHAVELVGAHAQDGLILDIGCGYGAVGDVLAEQGRTYVGIDLDPMAIADLARRGFEGYVVDLGRTDLMQELIRIVAGRQVGAVLMLDVVEHLVDPSAFLGALTELCTDAASVGSGPTIIASIPNVSHIDLVAKLAGGRWDVTPSGLLDRTHVQMFTARRIESDFAAYGWFECGRLDVPLDPSDQSFPADHPLLERGTPAHQYLRSLRDQADDYGVVNQFVRAYRHDLVARPAPEFPVEDEGSAPFLTVLTRTLGNRPAMLAEALTCLAAQTLSSLEVIVLVHTDLDEIAVPGIPAAADEAVTSVRGVVAGFDDSFADRVRVERVVGGGRAAPLNAGLGLARGRYIAFLDDDDLVTANWAASFAECAQRGAGKTARSICKSRYIRTPSENERRGTGAHSVTLTNLVSEFRDQFDLLQQIPFNFTPIISYAIPRALVSEFRLSFNEGMSLCEDWEFLLRAVLLVGLVDSGHITSIYQRWDGPGTTADVTEEEWIAARAQLIDSLDAQPLLLPAGSASVIADLVRSNQRTLELEARVQQAEQARDEILRSEFWRLSSPLRSLVTWSRTKVRQ